MKKLFFILMILFGTLSSHAERTALINNPNQITVSNIGSGTIGNLIDDKVNTSVHSQTGELSNYCYIQVALHEGLNLQENEDLIVYLQRCDHNENEAHPTAFKVQGSMDGTNWDESWDTDIQSCHVYFLYRGPKTKEYSTRIRTSKNFKYLRFTVMANSGRKHDAAGHRYMGLAEFQIYKLGRNDNYSPTQIDRFRLTSDYYTKLTSYKFENTQGILDARNRQGGRNNIADIANWCDWSAWQDGKWTKDTELLEKAKVQMPDYTMLTSETDGAHGYKPDAGQQRQPTHVTEHILYAIPGDAIALYPYYSFTKHIIGDLYMVNFAHWYDYQSGGHLNVKDESTGQETSMLDFLINPSAIHKNNNFGYFAGEETGWEPPLITTPEEYISFARSTYEAAGQKLEAVLGKDLDFTGYTDVPSIGGGGIHFEGTLDGNGYTIKNLRMSGTNNVGLIAKAGNGTQIKNLIIDSSCTFTGSDKVAAVVAEELYANGITIENVQCYATVTANNGSAAALIGKKGDSYDPGTIIRNCFVGGNISGTTASAVANWNNRPRFKIQNTVSTATVNNISNGNFIQDVISTSSIENCYWGDKLPLDLNSDNFIQQLGDGWQKGSGGHAVPVIIGNSSAFKKADSYFGKVATFFCPRSPYTDAGILQELPFRPGENEFIIAADFSQSFDHTKNLKENTIIEPIIQFRHIFRIRDGKKFAEELSGSVEKNQEYVRKNLRRVSARADVPFQIRLDSPIPQKGTTRSKYYYKISDTDYRRVCTMDIEVKDLSTGNIVQKVVIDKNGNMTDGSGKNIMSGDKPTNESYFYYGEEFDGEGTRVIDGISYNICGGGGKYYRMLKCNKPSEGRYQIRIIGNDINGNNINIIGSQQPLVVMEMELTVLPESAASLVSDAELYANDKYLHAREEELEKAYGAPKQKLTFDEYAALENMPQKSNYLVGSNHKYTLKWPMPWDDVTYSFDYNETRNYNMYTIASHSGNTAWHAAAAKHVNPDNSTGLYDRLYYKTMRLKQNPVKYGYFYYVNASADPGVMAKLRLEDLCMGSTIHVSAWVAEFSDANEVANISFNFTAVLNEAHGKERIPLHSFISGYVPKKGEWMNVYYSFVPNYTEAGLTPDMIDHYELELDNNCKNSEAADYAIDNIRLYVTSPIIYATQNEPICDKAVQEVDVRIEAPFDALLQVMGATEATEKEKRLMNLYYTFIDKQKFDEAYERYTESGEQEPGKKAYEASVLKYNYSGTKNGSNDQAFGMVSFNLNFASNPEYDENKHDISETAWRVTGTDGTRLIVFNTRPQDKSQLSPGKEYYVSIYSFIEKETGVTEPGWTEFDITDPCARACVFRVKPTSTIKIDGEIREDVDNITCCENQSPVVQVDLWGKKEDGTISDDPIKKNARMDWYNGSYDEFLKTTFGEDIPLSALLIYFRTEYPDAEIFDNTIIPQGDLTQEMIDYLKKLSEEIPEGESRPLLNLSQTSYVFPPTQIPEGEEYSYCHAVAIPIIKQEGNILVCTQPTEVRIRVQHVSPILNHGIERITYPAYMVDVPLRIGLKQLKAVSIPETETPEKHLTLRIPFRKVKPATEGINRLQLVQNKPYIYLVETNDPDYQNLGTTDDEGHELGALMPIGIMTSLNANTAIDNKEYEGNYLNAVFYDSFQFKEGYYYRMRFAFEEPASSNPGIDENNVCGGQDVFTIKVVPEYQRWIGNSETSKNWNNDENWTRVSSSELLLADFSVNEDKNKEFTDHVTDGTNSTARSYAPLNFTKVIIPSGDVFPHLSGYTNDNIVDFGTYYNPIKDEYPFKNNGVYWIKEPTTAEAGPATEDIQYDMAASLQENINELRCRPWYANTCEQIHFRPKSEIMGQQNLIYQKAWVDIATKPGPWHLMCTPLQTVFAGDLYLPSDNGRQATELFQEMTFDAKKNNRFKPAVYQRGWDKSKATVYEMTDSGQRNVVVKADWSNVYNDVTEEYGKGTGFSIKTDASKIGNVEEVLFRLPKSDTFFDYYSEDGQTVGNNTSITRTANTHFKLNSINPITNNNQLYARSAGNNRYFLIGNPFMAHLDMKEFFKNDHNKKRIHPKYWVLENGIQKVGVYNEETDEFTGSADGTVDPMQGFFVEAKEKVTYPEGSNVVLELRYDASMACTAPFGQSSLRAQSRSDHATDYNNVITISAIRNNRMLSQAFINFSPDADKAYNETDDAVLIDNSQLEIPAEVYTVADHTALSVNTTNQVNGTEIGLMAEDDNETVLMFEGVGELSDVSLYDAATRTRTPLSEGMKYTVKGSVAGRLFLKSDREELDNGAQSIKVDINRRNVRVASGNNSPIAVKVYTAEGMMVVDKAEGSSVVEFNLGRGIYILEATDDVETEKRKIVIL